MIKLSDQGFICSSCDISCANCSPDLQCLQCSAGYFFDTGKRTCLKCSSSCEDCYGPGSDNCLACKAAYFWSYSFVLVGNSCVLCPNYCKYCWPNSENFYVCLSCIEGLVLYNGQCVRCPSISCVYCENTETCLLCQNGFYLSNRGLCIECMLDCLACNNETKCLICKPKFYLHTVSESCEPCDKFCSTCFGPTEYDCFQCVEGSVYFQGRCEVCSNCALTPGYKVPFLCSEACKYTSNANKGMSNCSDPLCNISSFTNSSTTTKATCLECKETYYKKNEQCLSCGPLCSLCKSDQICLRCTQPALLVNNSCIICPSSCKDCITNFQGKIFCLSCLTGFRWEPQGFCLACPEGCQLCETETTC